MSRSSRGLALPPVLFVAALVALGACGTKKDDGAPTLTREALTDPATCKQCHADHFDEWAGSMHAYAAEDPVFLAMNRRGQRETNGALGTFCVKCHAPIAVRDGLTKDGLNLADLPSRVKGVTCYFCHSVDRVEGTHDAALHLSDDLVMRGPFADPVANTAHKSAYSPLHDRDCLDSADSCGACHDIVTGHGAELERTLAEWKISVFAKAPGGATCGQCHMHQSDNLEPVAQAPGVFARRRHTHTFAGVDLALTPFPGADTQSKEVKAFLDSTLQSALCVGPGGIRVVLDNVAGGHFFPSGATQDRRLWVEIIAYSGAKVVYTSGVVPDGEAVASSKDPDLWLMRDCLFDTKGVEVHDFWDTASTEGNALPAQTTFDATDRHFYDSHIMRRFPLKGTIGAVVDRATMRVRLRPMDFEVLDDLILSGDLDKSVRGAVRTHDLGVEPLVEWTAAAATDRFVEDGLPYTCVSKTNLSVAGDKTVARERTRCKP